MSLIIKIILVSMVNIVLFLVGAKMFSVGIENIRLSSYYIDNLNELDIEIAKVNNGKEIGDYDKMKKAINIMAIRGAVLITFSSIILVVILLIINWIL
ncbi:MAG: hypothetical protein RR359_04450 [Bacilli bacterium]